MLKSSYRDKFKWIHIQIGVFFSKAGISPNAWTALSLAPALLGFIFLAKHNLAAGLICFVASGFIDIIDGNVARVTKSVSSLGAFLDGVIDRYVEFLLYLGLWLYIEHAQPSPVPNGILMLVLVFGAMMPSFITAYADHRNVVADPERLKNIGGVIERFERLILIYLGMLLGLINPVLLTYTLVLTAVLTNLTAFQRIINVIRAK